MQINKPFIVLLNCLDPKSDSAVDAAEQISKKHGVSAIPVNCLDLTESDIKQILSRILYEFPIKEININFPKWINSMPINHWLRADLINSLRAASGIKHIKDVNLLSKTFENDENTAGCTVNNIDLGLGTADISIAVKPELFYKVLAEMTGLVINDEQELMNSITELAKIKKEYMRVKDALDEVEATGYGIVMPTTDELSLEEPEFVKQGGRYGVRLRASAPSIHLMKANITTEVSPIVGSEKQSEDLIMYLLNGFEDDPTKIWDSNIFGKSLHELVNEGLHTKLARMPADARMRVQETIERVINDGCNGLVCIIL